MAVAERRYDTDDSPRDCDRWSSVLGQHCRIMQPLGTPKLKEECQPFTFELYPALSLDTMPMQAYGGFGHSYQQLRQVEEAEDARKPVERLLTSGGHLAARCSRCSKKGKNCSESRSANVRHACLLRQCGGSKRS